MENDLGDRSRSGWASISKVQAMSEVVRQFGQHDRNKDQEGRVRGLQKKRKDKPEEARDPPIPSRPPYGHFQQALSDPGPQIGQIQGYGSSYPQTAGGQPPPAQQSQGQYGTSVAQQSYHQPQPGSTYSTQNGSAYQYSSQDPYSHNQQTHSGPLPPNSPQYSPYNHGYQSPLRPSAGYQQGIQGSQSHSSSAAPYNGGMYYNTQSPNMSPNDISNSYGGFNPDPSLGRINSALPTYRCQYDLPNGSCSGCDYHDCFGRPRR